MKQVKGRRRFDRRFAGRHWPDSAAAEPHCEKGNPGSTGHPRAMSLGTRAEDPRKNRAIDPTSGKEFVRFTKPEPVSEPDC